MQGVQLDASSAGALHTSLQALRQHEDKDLIEIMQLLVTKPMQVYPPFVMCSDDLDSRRRPCIRQQNEASNIAFQPATYWKLCTFSAINRRSLQV